MRQFIELVCAVVIVWLTGCSSDPATNAAIAGGTLAAVGLGSTLATHSQVEVRVEEFSLAGLSPRKKSAFIISDTAIANALRPSTMPVDPVQNPSAQAMLHVREEARPFIEKVRKAYEALSEQKLVKKNVREEISRTAEKGSSQPLRAIQDVSDFYALQRELARQLLEAWNQFDNAVTDGLDDGVATDAELTQMSVRLADLRQKVDALARVKEAPKVDNAVAQLKSLPPTTSIKPEVRQAATEFTTNYLKSATDRLPDFAEKLHQNVTSLSFSNINASVNFGPIIKEVMQAVFSKGDAIDVATDPKNAKRWHLMNSAFSHAGTGNHDAVIYLENLASPILKSGAFDPSKFTEAYGDVYRTAFGAAARAYGYSLSPTSQPINPASARAREESAKSRSEAAKNVMLQALAATIAAAKPYSGTGPTSDSDRLKAAAEAKKSLEATAVRLENLSAASP
jgi:hypothetical protein